MDGKEVRGVHCAPEFKTRLVGNNNLCLLVVLRFQYYTVLLTVQRLMCSTVENVLMYWCWFESRSVLIFTERGGSVVTHETRIREVPGSNPGADQPD